MGHLTHVPVMNKSLRVCFEAWCVLQALVLPAFPGRTFVTETGVFGRGCNPVSGHTV